MRDWDRIQAEEAAQQEVVDGIVRALYREYDEPAARAEVVGLILRRRYHGPALVGMNAMGAIVDDPIEAFTSDEEERRVLVMRVCAKLFGGLVADSESAWLRVTLERVDAPTA